MIAYGERMHYPDIDAAGLLEHWADRVERLLRACVRDRHLWPEAQSVDVPFESFIADDMAVVRQLRAFLASYPRGKAWAAGLQPAA